jgi:hypothetical protein
VYSRKRSLYSSNTSFLISKISLSIIMFCIVFIIQMVIFGFLPFLRNWYIGNILVSAVLFAITSFIFVAKFVKIRKQL